MPKHYLIVVNRHMAKFFTSNLVYSDIAHFMDMQCPEGRAMNRELVTDKPGRGFEQGGEARHTMDPGHSRVEKEAERFAGEIAQQVDKLRTGHALSQLTLVAEPTMLGLLRKKLNAPSKELIRQTFSKDLAQLSDEEIQKSVQRAA